MPKHTRSSSSNHNRYSAQMPVSMSAAGPAAPMPIYSSRPPQLTMNTDYYPTVASTSAQPAMQDPTYDAYSTAPAVSVSQPPMPHRASSGAWTPQDDQNLLAARQQGLNWAQIQATYFPTKSPNACRKRHERLMERKGADDFDQRRMERLAKEYMSMRKEIWQPLATRTGEKWNVVESMCMSNGLKNLQTAARSASRRERLESGGQYSGYDDDSGISGIGLTPVDDLDASYSSPAPSSHSSAASSAHSHAAAAAAAYAQAAHHHQAHPMYAATANPYGPHPGYGATNALSSSFGSSHSSTGAYHTHAHHPQGDSPQYLAHGQRLPSVDMGIDAIMNRPRGGHHHQSSGI